MRLTILSLDDPRIQEKEYELKDKFIIKDLDSTFPEEITSILEDKKVILEVLGYVLTKDGEIWYDLITIELEEELTFRWVLSDENLKDNFTYLGNDFQKARFVFLDV